MEQKTKLIIGGSIIGILALIAIYMLFFSGESVDRSATEANLKAAAAVEEENAKNPLPPPPPFVPTPGSRAPKP